MGDLKEKELKKYLEEYECDMIQGLEREMQENVFQEGKLIRFERCQKRKKYVTRGLKITLASVALCCIIGVSSPTVRSAAIDWFSDFLHLEVRVKEEAKTNEKGDTVKKKGKEVVFHSQMDITERGWWEYIKEHEIDIKKRNFDMMKGYLEDTQESEYVYMINPKKDNQFDDTRPLIETDELSLFEAYSYATPGYHQGMYLGKIYKSWTKGKAKVDYYERIDPWTKKETYYDVENMVKTKISGYTVYLIYTQGKQVYSRVYLKGTEIQISISGMEDKAARKCIKYMVKTFVEE